jgi:hypothetical protein
MFQLQFEADGCNDYSTIPSIRRWLPDFKSCFNLSLLFFGWLAIMRLKSINLRQRVFRANMPLGVAGGGRIEETMKASPNGAINLNRIKSPKKAPPLFPRAAKTAANAE